MSVDPSPETEFNGVPHKWLVAVAVMVPTFIEILDMTVVNVSLNHIQGSLSAGLDEVTWVLTSYLVSNAVVIPMSGWLARRIGRSRYLLLSVGLFTSASLFCGTATSLGMLLAFRVLQGIGGGGLQPLSQAILLESFPQRQHGMAMAIFGMGIVLAPVLGPILGGWITDNWSWRWVFYINVPVGLLSIALVLLFVHDPPYLRDRSGRIDVPGIAMLVLGIGCLQIMLDRGERLDWFASAFIQRLALVSAVALISFVVHELRTRDPVVDLRVFRDRSFAAGNVVIFCGFFAFFASLVLLPLYVQKLMGYTALWAGLVLAPGGVTSFLAMPAVGQLMRRMDSRKLLLAGIAVNAYALYLMSRLTLGADFFAILWPRAVQGAGLGLFFVPLATATVAYIPREKMGNASAVFNLMRNLGGSFGVAVMTTQLARRSQVHQHRLVDHLTQYDGAYQEAVGRLSAWLGGALGGGPLLAEQRARGLLYGELNRQVFMLGFNDAFYLDAFFFVAVIALVFLIRRADPGAGPPGAH